MKRPIGCLNQTVTEEQLEGTNPQDMDASKALSVTILKPPWPVAASTSWMAASATSWNNDASAPLPTRFAAHRMSGDARRLSMGRGLAFADPASLDPEALEAATFRAARFNIAAQAGEPS